MEGTDLSSGSKIIGLLPVKDKFDHDLKLGQGRTIVGSSDACDIVIPFGDVSGIHAVIERKGGVFKVYDLNSKNGTYINGDKIVSNAFKEGDKIRFSLHEFVLGSLKPQEMLPPKLNMLESLPPIISQTPKKLPTSSVSEGGPQVPRVEYPLAADPKAEFSEYIFEDIETLYPIFKYDMSQRAVEVVILFKEKVLSIDYLPLKSAQYKMVGARPSRKEIEFTYLGKTEKLPFIDIDNNRITVHTLPGYEAHMISDIQKAATGSYDLGEEDLLCFKKDDLAVFVRGTEAPPRVKPAPILRRDKEFKKYLLLMFLLVGFFLGGISLFEVDKEELKEKDPERIATILYKKPAANKSVAKTKDKPKQKIQKTDKPKIKPVKKVDKPKAQKSVSKDKKKTIKPIKKTGLAKSKKIKPPKKAKPRKGKVTKVRPIVKTPKKKAGGKKRKSARNQVRRTKTPRKTRGPVDTYKSFDFKSTLSNIMSKGGTTKAITSATSKSTADIGDTELSIGGESATVRKAKVSKDIGSLSDAASGKLDTSKGVSGLVRKGTIYTAGVPDTEVVLGGMDPDVIRKILLEHRPQFTYCYQKILDRKSRQFSGALTINFTIGASGHVSKAGVEDTSVPLTVRKCIVNVVQGIKFPEPPGGGIVSVRQPFFLQSRQL